MKRILLYIILSTIGLSISQIHSTPLPLHGEGSEEGAVERPGPSDVFSYFFFEAQRQNNAHNYDAAYDLFNFCLTLNPNSGAVLYELSSLNKYLRNDSLSIAQMEKAVELYPDNYWYKDQLVRLYFNCKKTAEAQATLEQMSVQFPEKEDVLMMLLDIYAANSDYDNVLKTLDKVEVKEGKSEQISMEKFRTYLQKKDEKGAFREMNALAEEYPNDLRYQVLIGDLYLDQNKPDEAFKVYNQVKEKEPDNLTLALSLMQYYQKEGPDSLYDQQLEKLITHPSLDDNNRLQLVSSLVYQNMQNDADSTHILHIFEKAISLPQKDTRMYELYARYMINRKMPTEKVKPALYKMLEIDPENDIARNQLLAYAIDEEDTTSIIRICKPAVDYSSENPVYYYYLGFAYYQVDSVNMAIETFRKGLAKNKAAKEEDRQLTANMYLLLGDLYHKAKMDDKCFEAYDSCLIYRPDDALVLNNYAYYLSLQKKNLKHAEEMSRRSNELEKDNATYLDTLAWVLYAQKRYDEAKEMMDKAVNILGEEINDDDNDGIRSHVRQINEKAKKK